MRRWLCQWSLDSLPVTRMLYRGAKAVVDYYDRMGLAAARPVSMFVQGTEY
jgi:hypothetical protein